mgnify:FL=1
MNETAERTVNPGEVWKHFKGKEVKILTLAKNESDCSDVVVYTEGKNTWVRPINEFLSEIDFDKHPEYDRNLYRYRFVKCTKTNSNTEWLDNEISENIAGDIEMIPYTTQIYYREKADSYDSDAICYLIAFDTVRFATELQNIYGTTGFQNADIVNIIGRLLKHYPVSPISSIDETPDEWVCIDKGYLFSKNTTYQNKRYHDLIVHIFDKDNVVYEDFNRFTPIDVMNMNSNMYIFTCVLRNFMNKLHPISMPYYPNTICNIFKFVSFPTAATNYEYVFTDDEEFGCYVSIFDTFSQFAKQYYFYLIRDELKEISADEFTNALNEYTKHVFDRIKPGAVFVSHDYGLIHIPNVDIKIDPNTNIRIDSYDVTNGYYIIQGCEFLDVTRMRYVGSSLDEYIKNGVDYDDFCNIFTQSQREYLFEHYNVNFIDDGYNDTLSITPKQ